MADMENTIDPNLANSIAMLEQILEVMPQDIDALKALYGACQKVGRNARAFEYLNRIIDVYMGGGGAGLLPFIQQELKRHEAEYPSEVAAQAARLRMMADSASASKAETPSVGAASPPAARSQKKDTDISEELALAWKLYEENQLSQEEYSSVLHDLTEVSSKELDVPVSVLHVLNDRGFTQMNRIMNYLSARSGVPCISLAHFELSEKVACALPLDIPLHDGALPFSFLGNDLLVGVLNPFNHVLVDRIESVGGHRCHTYLVESEDYDAALGRLRTLAQKASSPDQP